MAKKIKLAKETVKSNFSNKEKYDLIIIGSGISGLSSGLIWLKNTKGKKTLIIEKNSYTGGFVTAYERGGYIFETTQLLPDVVNVMDYLELDIKLKKFKGTFMRRIVVDGDDVSEYKIPTGADNFVKYLSSIFPEDKKNIESFMKYGVELFAQVRKLKTIPTFKDKITTPFVAPKVVANLNRTYSELLDKFKITNTKLREVMETFSAFSGVPSDKASAVMSFGAMLSAMNQSFRPYGYFDELPTKMTKLFQNLGGEVRLSSEVEKIIVKDGKVKGVKVKGDSSMITADMVITTLDPMLGMRRLVGDENLPEKYVERLENTLMSPSSINIALGLDNKIDLAKMDLDYPYNVISTGLGTTEALFDGFLAGDNGFTKDRFHAGVLCPSLTTGAKNTITIRGVPFGLNGWLDWKKNDPKKYAAEKERWGDYFIDIIERYVIPNLSKHIAVKDIATPATYSRYSSSPTGSIYDMATLVTQFGPKRLPMKTPIENLFQPKFAHGIYGGMMNGIQVVDLILDRAFNDGNSLFNPR
jgi:phytoene dehydrogenase-like protein